MHVLQQRVRRVDAHGREQPVVATQIWNGSGNVAARGLHIREREMSIPTSYDLEDLRGGVEEEGRDSSLDHERLTQLHRRAQEGGEERVAPDPVRIDLHVGHELALVTFGKNAGVGDPHR